MSNSTEIRKTYKYRLYRCDKKDRKLRHKIFVASTIWNHFIDRPALVWDSTDGLADETVTALREGRGDSVRPPAPTEDELRARLDDELRVSLLSLRDRNRDYDERRWKPGKLEPVADALWRASDGYLDVLNATSHG